MAVDRTRRPSPGPSPQIRLPQYERLRLPNGLSVVAVRHDDLPEVSARVVIPFGASDDERERAGTALLVARALTEGTQDRTAGEVAEWLDFLGARFSVDVNHDATTLSLHFLSRVFDEACAFLVEVLALPGFDPKEVGRLRDERLDEIASSLDEPRAVASLRLHEACFGNHPYGMRTGGVEDTVREIGAETLRAFHSSYYRAAGATLILVGDLPAGDVLQSRLSSAFSVWSGDPEDARPLADPSVGDGRRLWAIPWDGPQSEIRVGGLGIRRLDPDYPAVVVMNAILGGLFSSRINMNLREDKGWTYGAASHFDARKRRGPYYTATAVDAAATVPAVREILGELERMKVDPASDAELELAKNALTLSLPRLFETVGQVSGRVAQQVVYGLPDDYWVTYRDQVAAVTREDVLAAAQRLLSTEHSSIVVVGPVRDFHADLETLGPVEIRDTAGRPSELKGS